jgi:hypothetical protein
MKLRSAEGVLVPALFSYAVQEFGEEFFDEAWDEFFLWNDAPDDVEDSKEFGTTFDPFFVFAFVPESAEDELPAGWPTEPVALHFLHHEVGSAPDFQYEFIEQACKSPASFFVVEEVAPGRSLDIKDILTGRRFHVLEQSASQTLKVGDLTFTRVITAGGASILIGACPWVIPASWHIPIIDMRERFRPKGLLTREPQASSLSAASTRWTRPTFRGVERYGTSHSQRNASCADEAHDGIGRSVPASVPELVPIAINRQPTPTKVPIRTRCHLSKPPPSASRPPHRDGFS